MPRQPADDGRRRLLDRCKFLTEFDDGLPFDPVDQTAHELVEEVNGILRIGSGTLQEKIGQLPKDRETPRTWPINQAEFQFFKERLRLLHRHFGAWSLRRPGADSRTQAGNARLRSEPSRLVLSELVKAALPVLFNSFG